MNASDEGICIEFERKNKHNIGFPQIAHKYMKVFYG